MADDIVFHLSQFDGPLDLLLHLIDRAQIDVRDIFVSSVTEQYLACMGGIDSLDMDTASAFLEMAATLLWIKSRALLPKPPPISDEEEESPEDALKRRLEEHRTLKTCADLLRQNEACAADLISKLPEELPDMTRPVVLSNLTPKGLTDAWMKLIRRLREREAVDAVAAPSLAPSLRRDPYTIEACMSRLMHSLRRSPQTFESLFDDKPTLSEMVTTFIALLELIRTGSVAAHQSDVFGTIWIELQNS